MISFVCVLAIVVTAGAAQDVYWRDYIGGQIPADAVPGEPGLYIGQMPMNGILPSTIYPNRKVAVSECFTRRVEASEGVKILCSSDPRNLKWEFVNINSLTNDRLGNLVRGGIEVSQVLYIGKVFHEGQWKIGKVFPASHNLRGLRIWTNSGDLYVSQDFQILKFV